MGRRFRLVGHVGHVGGYLSCERGVCVLLGLWGHVLLPENHSPSGKPYVVDTEFS